MTGLLDGKACMITGAARGIGAAIAETFLAQGARVCLCDVDGAGVLDRQRVLDPDGGRTIAVEMDVTGEESVDKAVATALGRWGRIDVLVNSAGVLKHLPIEEMSLEDFERVVRVNLTGTFLMCRAAVREMVKQGGGKIVNIASIGGRTGRPGVGVNYAASKSGVIGLTRTLAKEKGFLGICVNAIAPGPIITELTRSQPPEVIAAWNAGRAVERDGSPEDVAQAALFLASAMSDWITGATLDINGGILMR